VDLGNQFAQHRRLGVDAEVRDVGIARCHVARAVDGHDPEPEITADAQQTSWTIRAAHPNTYLCSPSRWSAITTPRGLAAGSASSPDSTSGPAVKRRS